MIPTKPLAYLLAALYLVLTACTSTLPSPSPTPTTPTATASARKSLIASIEAVDSYTIRFTLNRPDAAFLQKLAFPALGPQSIDNIKKYNGGGDLIHNPVGTGPFKFVEWVPGDHITLKRNESCWVFDRRFANWNTDRSPSVARRCGFGGGPIY